MSVDLKRVRQWINQVIKNEDPIPHATTVFKGYRIFIVGVNLVLESNGMYWDHYTTCKAGDEIYVIPTTEIIKI